VEGGGDNETTLHLFTGCGCSPPSAFRSPSAGLVFSRANHREAFLFNLRCTVGIKIEVDGWDVEEALDRACHHVIDNRVKALENEVKEAVAAAVDEKIRSITEEMLRAEVTRLLTEGWPRTNQYGEHIRGEPLTLKSRCLEYLTTKDSYSHRNIVEEIFKDEMHKALKGDLGKVISEATDKLRAMVDGQIAEKMRDVLKGLFR
jgi:hypothetical protein